MREVSMDREPKRFPSSSSDDSSSLDVRAHDFPEKQKLKVFEDTRSDRPSSTRRLISKTEKREQVDLGKLFGRNELAGEDADVEALIDNEFLKQTVKLPLAETCASWVSLHAIEFFNDLTVIWSVLSMDPYLKSLSAGEGFPPGLEYRLVDADRIAFSVSAPVYVDEVLRWIAVQINDETQFPDEFLDEENAIRVYQSPKFATLCGRVFRRLFRVYAIIYSSCHETVEALGMDSHLDLSFQYFLSFSQEFGLLNQSEMHVWAWLMTNPCCRIEAKYRFHSHGAKQTMPVQQLPVKPATREYE